MAIIFMCQEIGGKHGYILHQHKTKNIDILPVKKGLFRLIFCLKIGIFGVKTDCKMDFKNRFTENFLKNFPNFEKLI